MTIFTSMADAEEIQGTIEAAREGGCKELAILHCVRGYPAPVEDYNLRAISEMMQRFGLFTGLSDHTLETPRPLPVLRWVLQSLKSTLLSIVVTAGWMTVSRWSRLS